MPHPNLVKGISQTAKLYQLLKDREWHRTPEILQTVYGSGHLGIARIAARVYDLNKKLEEDELKVVSRKVHGSPIWEYKIETI